MNEWSFVSSLPGFVAAFVLFFFVSLEIGDVLEIRVSLAPGGLVLPADSLNVYLSVFTTTGTLRTSDLRLREVCGRYGVRSKNSFLHFF